MKPITIDYIIIGTTASRLNAMPPAGPGRTACFRRSGDLAETAQRSHMHSRSASDAGH